MNEHAPLQFFRELFGQPLELWLFDGQCWQPLESTESAELQTSICPTKLAQPLLREIAPGVLSIGLPLHLIDATQPHDVVLWGVVRTTLELLGATLLQIAALKTKAETVVAELQAGVDPHLEQISRDFEELNWLRELNERLFESSVDDPLETVARRILPDLRQLIAAESIAIVTRTCSEPVDIHQTSIGWCGPQLLSDNTCRKLVQCLVERGIADRPTIVNHLGALQFCEEFPGIESCLQVAIVRQGTEYGWLLALNRAPAHARYPRLDQSALTQSGLFEFGTEEAGLMYSAAATLASHARNAELFREKENLLIGILKAMINALDAKDPYTCGHSDRVASTARQIGERLGLEARECDLLYMSGLLHDIGKIGIPDEVLLKPGKLTPEEFEIIAQHPSIGHAILSHLPQLKAVLPGVLHHHEHLNGNGYPHKLTGDDIPLFGRILAVADAFDAMTTCRPYRTAMPFEKARGILQEGAGTQWDPAIVEAFLACLPEILEHRTQNADGLQNIFEAAAASQHALGERDEARRRTVARWSSRSAMNASLNP